ncbi:MAG: PriCT-2 domain-containing protein [Neisseriaceae bacterium]|nr:PriCT-2 domain-containing protein [Neisseriaceae bacterium]
MSISNVSEDEIRTALTYIDATDRLTWLRVGTALKTEFGESGFNLFD